MTRTPAITKPCPECRRPMLVRTNRENGSEFLGCTGWPDFCGHTERLPEYLRLLASGATALPGFDA